LASAGCAGQPIRAYHAPDEALLRRGRTFQWLGQAEAAELRLSNPPVDYMGGTVRIERDPDLDSRLRPKVEESLRRKGFRPVTQGMADLFVTFYVEQKDGDWSSSWDGSTVGVENVPIVMFPDFDKALARRYSAGNVYLVLYDVESKRPVWTGVMEKTLDPVANVSELFREELTPQS
jgi:hypothetical protein